MLYIIHHTKLQKSIAHSIFLSFVLVKVAKLFILDILTETFTRRFGFDVDFLLVGGGGPLAGGGWGRGGSSSFFFLLFRGGGLFFFFAGSRADLDFLDRSRTEMRTPSAGKNDKSIMLVYYLKVMKMGLKTPVQNFCL